MFYFTDDCRIGIEQLDEEHRYLFELLGKMDELLHADYMPDRYDYVKNVLRELEEYADTHFAHEEGYMREICDPELPYQRAQHTFFRDRIDMFFMKNIDSDEQQQEILEELTEFLAKWLYRHIIGSDIMIGKLPPLEEWMLKENPCEFSDEFLVGQAMIDSEHKMLFSICERALHLAKQRVDETDIPAIREVIKELKEYTIIHFQDEEAYMESIHYEGLPAQKRAHEAFIMKVELSEQVDFTKKTQEEFEKILEFLLSWLVNHILYMDKKIG